MNNPNFFRPPDSIHDDDRMLNDGIVSIVGDDYLLNFLNDSDVTPKRQPNNFNSMFHDMQIPFSGFQEPQKAPENFSNLYGKMNIQDSWLMQNIHEQNRNQMPINLGYKIENSDDLDGNAKLKKIKTAKDTSLNVKRPSESAFKQKNNIKNTYINKINTLITEETLDAKPEGQTIIETLKPELKKNLLIKNEVDSQNSLTSKANSLKKVRSYDVLKSDEINKLNTKLARNRESARKSRKRKKVYIELLEKKVEQLQQELDTTKKQLEQNSSSLNRFNAQNKLMNNIYVGEQTLYEKLEKMLANKSDETEISFLIDSLRLRLGANGKERVAAVNFFFKQVLDFLLPVHMKYLLWAAVEGKDVFNSKDTTLLGNIPPNIIGKGDFQIDSTEYWNEISSQLNLTDQQKKTVNKYRKKFISEKQKLETLVNSLNQNRKNLLKQTKSVQDIVDEFSNVFSPAQFGKLLISLDKFKDKKELNNKFWMGSSMKKENKVIKDDLSEESDDFMEGSTETNEFEEEGKNETIKQSGLIYGFDPKNNNTNR